MTTTEETRDIPLEGKDNFEQAVKRIYAWYEGQIIDRPPVRFSAHNVQYNTESTKDYNPEQWKKLWFDAEAVIDRYIQSIKGRHFLAETFPVYWPNLGPDIYAAFYESELTYAEVTSWSHPIVKSPDDIYKLNLDMNNEYFKKIEELTHCALEKCEGKFLVGYTDLHPGLDCVLAWRGTEQLCFDMIDDPELVKKLVSIASNDFTRVYNHFDSILKSHNQLSVTWMEIPSFGKLHIPSCDFAAMMSPQQFADFALPAISREIKHMTHNIFHLDGKDVARSLDLILELPEITAIQWVQGVGDDEPIMQWLPLIKKIQAAGKSLAIDLKKQELEDFANQIEPEGILLCIAEDDEQQQNAILKRIEKW